MQRACTRWMTREKKSCCNILLLQPKINGINQPKHKSDRQGLYSKTIYSSQKGRMAAAKTKRGKKKTTANKAAAASGRIKARSGQTFVQRRRGETNREEVEGDASVDSSGPEELDEDGEEEEENEDELSHGEDVGSNSDDDSSRDEEEEEGRRNRGRGNKERRIERTQEASRSRQQVSKDRMGENGNGSGSGSNSSFLVRNTSPPNRITINTPASFASSTDGRSDGGGGGVRCGTFTK